MAKGGSSRSQSLLEDFLCKMDLSISYEEVVMETQIVVIETPLRTAEDEPNAMAIVPLRKGRM